jgi:hypothetical protein
MVRKIELSERPKSISFTKIPTTESEIAQARSVKNKDLHVTLREPIFG